MPNFDSGTYFLTVLIPIGLNTVDDGAAPTSAVHAVRKEIARLSTTEVAQSDGTGSPSPFAKNTLNHLARFATPSAMALGAKSQAFAAPALKTS